MIHLKRRLEKIEKKLKIGSKISSAMVICDPDIVHTFDPSILKVKNVLILPQKDREPADPLKLKGTYTVKYF